MSDHQSKKYTENRYIIGKKEWKEKRKFSAHFMFVKDNVEEIH